MNEHQPYTRGDAFEYGDAPRDADYGVRGGDRRRRSRGRSELFPTAKPGPAGVIPDGTVVVGGTHDCAPADDPFVPRTAYISCSGDVTDTAVAAVGFVTIELTGIQPGQPFVRRFTLGRGQSVQVKIETFRDVTVKVLHSTALGVSCNVVVTEEVSYGSGAKDVAFYAVHYAPGLYYRPPGATDLLPSTFDAGFSWVCGGPGADVTIVDALVALTSKPARAPAFIVTAPGGVDLVWTVGMT